MGRRYIDKLWQSYRRDVVPADASPDQVEECLRAFMAGAGAMMTFITDSPAGLEEEMVMAIVMELEGWQERMRALIPASPVKA